MNNAWKVIMSFFIIMSLVLSSLAYYAYRPSPDSILYYGDTCPHCKNVEEYLYTNDMNNTLKIVMKEVYNDQANALEYEAAVKKCGLKVEDVGIPFYVGEKKCLVGDTPIIDHLTTRLQ